MIRTIAALVAVFFCLPTWGANCSVTEYTDVVNVNIPAAFEDGNVTRQIVAHTTATDSSQFQSTTRFIRVVCDEKSFFVISSSGTNPTTSSPYVPADSPEYFGVRPLHFISFCDSDCA